jgi:hypothetical protein
MSNVGVWSGSNSSFFQSYTSYLELEIAANSSVQAEQSTRCRSKALDSSTRARRTYTTPSRRLIYSLKKLRLSSP